MTHFFNPGSTMPDICCTNGCGKPASDAIHRAEYKVVMQSHDGNVLKNFITVSTEPDVLKRTEQLQAQYPGFTALWI